MADRSDDVGDSPPLDFDAPLSASSRNAQVAGGTFLTGWPLWKLRR